MSDELPPCVHDLLSVEGLRPLARRDPFWWAALHAGIRPLPAPSLDARPPTFEVLVRADRDGLLVGVDGPSLHTVRRRRLLLRSAVSVLGADEVAWIDEARLGRAWEQLATTAADGRTALLSAAAATQAIRFAARAVDGWRADAMLPPLGTLPLPKATPRSPRTTLVRAEIVSLLSSTQPQERLVVVLMIGSGLRPGEILRLRVENFKKWQPPTSALRNRPWSGSVPLELYWVRVRHPSDPSRCRWIPIPPWAWDTILSAPPEQLKKGARGSRALVKSNGKPRKSLRPMLHGLRRCRDRPRLRELAWADLRRVWMVAARHWGLPRSIVRGTWWQRAGATSEPDATDVRVAALHRFACSWVDLDAEPYRSLFSERRTVPRRARSGCRPNEPERRPPKPLPQPLPESALLVDTRRAPPEAPGRKA